MQSKHFGGRKYSSRYFRGDFSSDLGVRHVGYGAIAKHYGSVGDALLLTFEQYLQSDWTPQFKKAWLDAKRTITVII